MKKIFILLTCLASVTVISISCNNQQTNNEKVITDTETNTTALILLQNSCFSCHNPDKAVTTKIAPSLSDVRQQYMTDDISKKEFINNIKYFINHPTVENALMPEAISSYGIMPKLSYKDDDLQLIAEYMYNHDMSTDEWYTAWQASSKQPQPQAADISYEDLGLSIANGTKAQLGKNLMGAIKEHGTSGAVTFCNTRAIPLTDSMANVYHAYIKRVSDNPRNPDNNANETELAYINELKQQLAKGEKLLPKVLEIDGRMVGYYAIETNQMCLQCHGEKGKDILPETYTKIKKSYPADQATGYTPNQIRGIWVVSMDKN